MIIVCKFNILESFGAAYTMSSLDDERWINIQYLNICINETNRRRQIEEMQRKNKMEVFMQK